MDTTSTFTFHNIHHRDINASSSSLDSDLFESSEHHHHPSPSLSRGLLPAIPDLRFEQSYLKSIKGFVHVEEVSLELGAVDEKGKKKAESLRGDEEHRALVIRRDVRPIVDSSHHLLSVDWSQVVWVTTRDQVISPFLQGALWYALLPVYIPVIDFGQQGRCIAFPAPFLVLSRFAHPGISAISFPRSHERARMVEVVDPWTRPWVNWWSEWQNKYGYLNSMTINRTRMGLTLHCRGWSDIMFYFNSICLGLHLLQTFSVSRTHFPPYFAS